MNYLMTLIALAFVFVATPAAAQDIDRREHIEVIGVSEVRAVPNEFVIKTTLTSFNKKLNKASKANDEAVSRVFKQISKLGVQRKYIVTDKISVNAVTEGYRERGNFRHVGYTVSRNVMVVLHKATRLEPAMKKLFDIGVDRLTIATGHTDMKQLMESAEVKAATAAKDKGKRLAGALGRQLGQPVAIRESSNRNAPKNFVYSADTPDLGDTLSLEKLRITASIQVKFLLR